MRILLIGALNQNHPPQGGEEYKNQLLYKQLSASYGCHVVDTHRWKQRPFVLLNLIAQLFFSTWDIIIISASSHSVYQLVCVLQHFRGVAQKTIYFVIGGYFPDAVLAGTYKIKPYETLKSIVVEGESLKDTLLQAGYKGNIHVIPNFKDFPKQLDKAPKTTAHIKFVFLSRIHPDKGIGEIVGASNILRQSGFSDFSVTFYGPLDQAFKTQFESMLDDKLVYGGVLDIMSDTENAYRTLADFDAMLFPTYWKGEGFPGVLVDAFVAGLPVIASNWNMNREVIKHERNGLLIQPKHVSELADAMLKLAKNANTRQAMSQAASEEAEKFSIQNVWPEIRRIIAL
jgi:glycosyltransferase involved in cell wall biosynthesis